MSESKAHIVLSAEDQASGAFKEATLNIVRYQKEVANAADIANKFPKTKLIPVDNDGVRATEDMAKAMKSMDGAAKGATGSLGSFGATAFSVAAGFGIAQIGEKALQAFRQVVVGSLQAADALQAVHNRAEAVFGEDAQRMIASTDAMAAALHRNGSDLLNSVTQLSMVGEGLGMTSEAAQTMSQDLTELGVAFGRAFNSSDEDAITAIERALQGNTRGLKEYGIVMTDSTLKQYAEAEGIKVKLENMSSEQKAILTYHYLMDKTEAIQKAAQKNTGNMSDAIKGLKAAWNDLEENLGKVFMPIAKTVIEMLASWISMANSAAAATKNLTITLGLMIRDLATGQNNTDAFLSAKFKAANPQMNYGPKLSGKDLGLEDLNAALEKNGEAGKKWSEGWKDTSGSAGGAADDMATAMEELGKSYEEVTASISQKLIDLDRNHKNALANIKTSMSELQASHREKMLSINEGIADTKAKLIELANTYKEKVAEMNGQTFDKVGEQFTKIQGLFQNVQDGFNKLGGLSADQIASVIANRQDKDTSKVSERDKMAFNLTSDGAKQVEDVIALNKEEAALNMWLTKNLKLTEDQKSSIAVGSKDYTKNVAALLAANPDTKVGVTNANQTDFERFMKEQDKKSAALDKDNKKQTTEQQKALDKANDNARKEIKNVQDQMEKLNEKKAVEDAAYTAQRNQLVMTQIALNAFHDDYVAKLKDMTKVTKSELAAMKEALSQLTQVMSDAQAKSLGQNKVNNAKAKAYGGSTEGLTLVGENGPELLNLPAGTFVHGTRESAEKLSGGGGVTFSAPIIGTVHVHNEADEDRLVQKITRMIQLQRQGSSNAH